MSIDVLKPNKNTGLAVSQAGATRIFPGGYEITTSGAGFTFKDSDNNEYIANNGSVVYLPKGANQVSEVRSPLPSSWSVKNIPAAFKSPRGICTAANGDLYVLDSLSNIFKSTDKTNWTQVRTGTTGVELVHYQIDEWSGGSRTINFKNVQQNDVSVVLMVSASSVATPTGYTSIGYTTSPASNMQINQYYKVLGAAETSLTVNPSGNTLVFIYVIRGASTGSAPTFNGEQVTNGTWTSSRVQPAAVTPNNPGAFGISYIAMGVDSDSELLQSDTSTYINSQGALTYDARGLGSGNATANQYQWIGASSKILDGTETYSGVISGTNRISVNTWSSVALVFEPAATTLSSGFAATDIAASPTRIVATESNLGKTVYSTDGATWTVGSVAKASPTPPTVLWTYDEGTNSTTNTNSFTFPVSPALQEGDLVLLTLTNRNADFPLMKSSGWRLLDSANFSTATYSWSDSVYYKVMGATPDTSINVDRNGNNYIAAIAIRGASSSIRWNYASSTSGLPNSPSLTMRNTSVSVAMGALRNNTTQSVGQYTPNMPTGYTGESTVYTDTVMVAYKAITADGTEDPSVFLDPLGAAGGQWHARTFEVKSKDNDGSINSLIWDGTRFVGVGSAVFESTDGLSWTRVSNPAYNTDLVKVIYGNSTYVAGSSDGHIYTSANRTTWTVTKPTSYPITGLQYVGAKLHVTDSTGAVYTSEDLITWSLLLKNNTSITWFSNLRGAQQDIKFTANPGDLVVAFYTDGASASPIFTPSSTGWTTLSNTVGATSYQTFGLFYKYMGATPDTSFALSTALSHGYALMGAIVISKPSEIAAPTVNSKNNSGTRPDFNAATVANDNSLLISFSFAGAGSDISINQLQMGIRRGANYSREIPNNNRVIALDGNRAGFGLALIPYAREIAGGSPYYWAPTATSYYSQQDVVVPLKDTKPSATVLLNPSVIVVGQDGSATAATTTGTASLPSTGAGSVGAGVAFLNGRQVNILTSNNKQISGGNVTESAIIKTLG